MVLNDNVSMETCVLLPEEFSLKLEQHRSVSLLGHILPGLNTQPLDSTEKTGQHNSLRVCAAKKVSPQTRFLPFSGTVRTDALPLLPYLPPIDVRHRMGSYDEIVERSGKPVRLCNWVRFVKASLTFDRHVNMVATRSRGSVFFEASKEIAEGEDIVIFLIPESTENEAVSLSALSALRSSLYRQTLDSIMSESPLDLSKSLFSSNMSAITHPDKQEDISHKFPVFIKKDEELDTTKEDELQRMRLYLANIRNSSLIAESFPPRHPLISPYFPFGLPVPSIFSSSPFPLPGLSPVSSGLSSPSTTKPSSPPSPTQSPSSSSTTTSLKRPNPFGMDVPSLPPKRRERTMLPCSECGKAFDRPSLLKRHMRTHTGEKPHVCDVCSKGFSTSSSLNTHRRIHSGEKPHQCGVCGKRFTASSNLYYHKMTHVKEKPHKCTLCTRSFPTPGDLRSHMFVHNGQWPHKCTVCGKGFSKLTNLRNHELLHSGDRQLRKSNSGTSSPDINFSSNTSAISSLNPFLSYPNALLEARIKSRNSSDVAGTDCSLILPSPPLSPRDTTTEDVERRPTDLDEKAEPNAESEEHFEDEGSPGREVEVDIVVDEEPNEEKSIIVNEKNSSTREIIAAP